MNIIVVLPAYNEAENLPAIFKGLNTLMRDTYNLSVHLIVVDDGSTDGTAEVASAQGGDIHVEVLRNAENQGLARTFARGILAAAEKAAEDDIIVCMDADNSHLPGQILRMVRDIQEGRDVVIASRYREGAIVRGVAWHRRILSRGMSFLFRCVFPIPGVRDYSCGYRAYRAELLKKAISNRGEHLFAQEGFACMVAILLRLHKEGAICSEVPLVLRYDQKIGQSKMNVLSTITKTLQVLLKERICS
ncbi:MAG: glycosyltransferase [Verrucomicrobiae bacterium]|nr:glycosyltransferase [Verrucomicrobiae bacterium]